jgi:hypothetical protein
VSPLTGGYGPLPLLPGDYLLEANAPGYSLELDEVAVEEGITTTRDIGLWRPRVAAGPVRLQVTSGPGACLTAPLWITNTGHLALEYQLVELGPTPPAAARASTDFSPPPLPAVAPSRHLRLRAVQVCSGVV